jgi:hypothetical protein
MKWGVEIFVAFVLFLVGVAGAIYFTAVGATFLAALSGMLVVASAVMSWSVIGKNWFGQFVFPTPKGNNLRIRGTKRERAFLRVQNTINNRKVFVSVEDDGIYIRLAGDENNGEAFSEKKIKVYDYEI